MMRTSLILAMMMTLLVVSAHAEEEEKPAILVSLRFCEGKPDGNVEDGTLKVLSSPSVITLAGTSAKVLVGGETEIDGETVTHGIQCDIVPKVVKDDQLSLKIRFEQTELVDPERKDSVTVQGTCIRSTILAKPGEKVRIGQHQRDGKKAWLEVTAEIIKPGDVLAMPGHEVREPVAGEFVKLRAR